MGLVEVRVVLKLGFVSLVAVVDEMESSSHKKQKNNSKNKKKKNTHRGEQSLTLFIDRSGRTAKLE